MNFTKAVTVTGQLRSTYEFESNEDVSKWMLTVLPSLREQYGDLQCHKFDLPLLNIGDRCHVSGDGDEVYTIEGIKQYSPDRYGFLLDSGFSEEIYKCYPV